MFKGAAVNLETICTHETSVCALRGFSYLRLKNFHLLKVNKE